MMPGFKDDGKNVHFCVIGAGASGLPAVKSCLEHGASVTCYERSEDIGGLWRYTDEVTNKASVAKTTVINTSKELMAYSDFPIPAEYPNVMRHDLIMKYYNQYVDHFGLRKFIQFNTEVTQIECAPDYETTGKWNVTHKNLQTNQKETTTYDGVLVCTGHHAEPHRPKLPGLDSFKGIVLHSHDYKKGNAFVDKNVLVVGIGNSGGDVAVELCRLAKSLHISTRHGTWCFPRSLPNGMPIDSTLSRVYAEFAKWLPISWIDWYQRKVLIKVDHDLLGIRPSYGPTAQHVFVNDDFPNRVLSGLIKIQPDIKQFDPHSVTFVDGTELKDLDAVILATGYKFGFPFLPASILSVEANKVDLYKCMFPPHLKHPTLAIIGCLQPLGAVMPVSELQARWAVRVFSGLSKLPPTDVQLAEIEERHKLNSERYVASLRHTIQVDAVPYMDDLAMEIGCMPSVSWMLLTGDWSLAYTYSVGRLVPFHYRLCGPHSWAGAREAILTSQERIRRPLRTHINELYGSKKDHSAKKAL